MKKQIKPLLLAKQESCRQKATDLLGAVLTHRHDDDDGTLQQMQSYFILSAHDASGQPLLDVGVNPFWWQVFLMAAGMIAFINSLLVGVFVGLLLAVLTLPLLVCTSAGVVTFLVSFGLLQRYQWLHWRRLEQKLAVLFPSQPL